MKKIAVKLITISCLVLVAFLFSVLLFSKYKNNNDMVYVISNNNLTKMDDNTSLLFEMRRLEEKKKEEELKQEELRKQQEEKKKEEEIKTESIVESLIETKKEEKKEEPVQQVIEQPKQEEPQKEEKVEPVRTSLSEEREVLQTVVGNLTGYGPDCVGCGGRTSTGYNLYESIYYEDSEFGTVRILAADPSFPFYSIVRVRNVPTMDDFIGIVLDRGGNVGFGRGTLFDLAFESESSPNLVPLTRNVTFELLRSGR